MSRAGISVLSWSVDATQRTFHAARRRLPFAAARVPLIATVVAEANPDVVALQDSGAELVPALAERGFSLVGAVRNGVCGLLQVYVRSDGPWGKDATLLPTMPFATVALKSAGGGPLVLSCVDLSYRGKSLVVEGVDASAVAAQRDEGSFSFAPTAASQKTSADAALRFAALRHVVRAAAPDIVVGNTVLGAAPPLPPDLQLEDVWQRGGAHRDHAETTLTTVSPAQRAMGIRSNEGYFDLSDAKASDVSARGRYQRCFVSRRFTAAMPRSAFHVLRPFWFVDCATGAVGARCASRRSIRADEDGSVDPPGSVALSPSDQFPIMAVFSPGSK